jgi:uncharacterized protein
MKLDLRSLEEFPAQVALEDSASGLELPPESLTAVGKIRAEFTVIKSDTIYYCTGAALCDADLECARCLEPYRVRLRGDIEFSIQEVADETQVDSDEVPENEVVVPAGTTEIDVSGPVREALILALPLKPLCRDNCGGLCPICGINRNEQDCDCSVDEPDSRWDGLRDLLNEKTD